MTKEIKLTQNRIALVDDEDYDEVIKYNWYYAKGYAVRRNYDGGADGTIYLHREIAKTPSDMFTDHINRNKLDNRKENLRICTKSQNRANIGHLHSNTSGYKGVFISNGRWRAQITVNKCRIELGYFDDPKSAAIAYDNAAKLYLGEFAGLNFDTGE